MIEGIRRIKLKICMVGERAVGKTSLLSRYVFNTFDEAYRGTLGSRLCLMAFKQMVASDQLVEAEIALFDLMGESSARNAFKDVMFWGSHGFLAVADLTRSATIRALPEWIRCVHSVAGEIPFRILMNKSDLIRNQAIQPEDTSWLLATFPGVPFSLTSAKTGAGVEKAFDSLISQVIETAMSKSRARREGGILREKILAFADKRGSTGVSKKDLLLVFKNVDPNVLMKEVEDLCKLDLLNLEISGPASFIVRLTEKGRRETENIVGPERIVDEPA